MRMQEKILRVIEYGEFERVGGSDTVQVDVRILGATNADLPALTQQGQFRADLLDRLAFDVVNVPALRHRPEDIIPLAEHFAINVIRELGRDFFPGFTAACCEELLADRWPGNVRGLKNTVERSVYRSSDPDAQISRLVFDPFKTSFRGAAVDGSDDSSAHEPSDQATQLIDLPTDLKTEVAVLEKQLIDQAMQTSQYRQPHAARLLGLSYNQLRALLRKHSLVERYGRTRKRGSQ
jgi:psp operon transcriptional activator